jgi:hypothetical protein
LISLIFPSVQARLELLSNEDPAGISLRSIISDFIRTKILASYPLDYPRYFAMHLVGRLDTTEK